jgi:hypothetical protein
MTGWPCLVFWKNLCFCCFRCFCSHTDAWQCQQLHNRHIGFLPTERGGPLQTLLYIVTMLTVSTSTSARRHVAHIKPLLLLILEPETMTSLSCLHNAMLLSSLLIYIAIRGTGSAPATMFPP